MHDSEFNPERIIYDKVFAEQKICKINGSVNSNIKADTVIIFGDMNGTILRTENVVILGDCNGQVACETALAPNGKDINSKFTVLNLSEMIRRLNEGMTI